MEDRIKDEKYMARAINLALKGTGYVSPNPRVGAVIVKNNKIIGEGWHREFGGPHAEIEAINSLNGKSAKGADIYVNLEPCSHTGKTPPCAEALIQAGFARVVIGITDPNPLVNGKGVEMLRSAGIEVVTGILEEESRQVNRFFIKHITTGLPYVILKAAQSLNGAIATKSGDSKWITGEESLRRSHMLRAQVDAVLVGRQTVLADNPKLNVRNVPGRDPKRVVLDTNLLLPLDLNIKKDDLRTNTIICCKPEAAASRKASNLKIAGVKVLAVETGSNGQLDLNDLLQKLANDHKITSILVEGGARVLSSFLQNDLADEYHFFIAPMIIPGGKNAFEGFAINRLAESEKLVIRTITKSGNDIHVEARKYVKSV